MSRNLKATVSFIAAIALCALSVTIVTTLMPAMLSLPIRLASSFGVSVTIFVLAFLVLWLLDTIFDVFVLVNYDDFEDDSTD